MQDQRRSICIQGQQDIQVQGERVKQLDMLHLKVKREEGMHLHHHHLYHHQRRHRILVQRIRDCYCYCCHCKNFLLGLEMS